MANDKRGSSMLSTEPQARKILEKMNPARRKKLRKENAAGLKQGDKTATNPQGLQKTPEQGAKELEALRRKRKERST